MDMVLEPERRSSKNDKIIQQLIVNTELHKLESYDDSSSNSSSTKMSNKEIEEFQAKLRAFLEKNDSSREKYQ